MIKLIIAGAGGFGREVLDWAMDIPAADREWEVGGFLDLRPGTLPTEYGELPIWAESERDRFGDSERLVCAVGDPRLRLRICRSLKERGARFATLVHPTAIFGSNNRIGEGCIFCPRSGISNNVTLGSFVVVNCYSGLGHDSIAGEGCTLNCHVDVTGGVTLGEGVLLGSHATVLPGVKVGDYAVVGAGSVVLKNVRAGRTVFGVPAIEM